MSDKTAQPDSAMSSRRGSEGSSLLASVAGGVSRRNLLRAAGAGAAVVGGGGLLQACSSGIKGAGATSTSTGSGSGGEISIGWIHPVTGALAGFGAPDSFVLSKVLATPQYKNGFKIGGKTYKVNVKSYDTESSPTKAGQLAQQAINSDRVDMLFASSTPETVNAVASTAEALGTPLVCANIPWESWYVNLHGNPQKPTVKPKYVVMYFFGAEHLVQCFIPMWNKIHSQLSTNKVVGAAFPNDSDGNAFRAVFPIFAKAAGYTFDMSSAYTDGTANYSSMISTFKSEKADFFTNVPLPPDFATMWKQSAQQGFRPKLATVAKVLLFPPDAYALGSLVENVATDTWWVPTMPWTSSFTGETCQQMAAEFESTSQRPVEREHQQLQPLRDRARRVHVGEQPARQDRARRRHPQREHQGPGRTARLHLAQGTRARRRDHPAGRGAVAEGHQVPAADGGRRQHAAAERQYHGRAQADEHVTG